MSAAVQLPATAVPLSTLAHQISKYIGSGSVSSVRLISIGSSAAHTGLKGEEARSKIQLLQNEEAEKFKKQKRKKK